MRLQQTKWDLTGPDMELPIQTNTLKQQKILAPKLTKYGNYQFNQMHWSSKKILVTKLTQIWKFSINS